MNIKVEIPSSITLTKAADIKIVSYDAEAGQVKAVISGVIDVTMPVLEGKDGLTAMVGTSATLSIDGVITQKQPSTGTARKPSSGCSVHIRSSTRPYKHFESSGG